MCATQETVSILIEVAKVLPLQRALLSRSHAKRFIDSSLLFLSFTARMSWESNSVVFAVLNYAKLGIEGRTAAIIRHCAEFQYPSRLEHK